MCFNRSVSAKLQKSLARTWHVASSSEEQTTRLEESKLDLASPPDVLRARVFVFWDCFQPEDAFLVFQLAGLFGTSSSSFPGTQVFTILATSLAATRGLAVPVVFMELMDRSTRSTTRFPLCTRWPHIMLFVGSDKDVYPSRQKTPVERVADTERVHSKGEAKMGDSMETVTSGFEEVQLHLCWRRLAICCHCQVPCRRHSGGCQPFSHVLILPEAFDEDGSRLSGCEGVGMS